MLVFWPSEVRGVHSLVNLCPGLWFALVLATCQLFADWYINHHELKFLDYVHFDEVSVQTSTFRYKYAVLRIDK